MLFRSLGLIVFQIIPDKLLLLFNASEDMISIGSNALRIISWSYLFAGFCIVLSSVFQALGNGVYSLIVSVARQLFVLLPSAWILAEAFGLHAVWWSFPIAEIVSILLSILLFGRIYRKKIQTL